MMKTAGERAEIVVVGAGVMGLFTALELRERGHDVVLIDAWGPGHARGTSCDENRVIRSGYGGVDLYAGWAWRSLRLWTAREAAFGEKLLHPCGVLWMVAGEENYVRRSQEGLERRGIPNERLDRARMKSLYPQIDPRGIRWALLEPRAGTILARRACLAAARAFEGAGGRLRIAQVAPGRSRGRRLLDVAPPTAWRASARSARRPAAESEAAARFEASSFIFACGPWLPQIFPRLLGKKISVTRREVFYFGTPPGDDRFSVTRCPVWLETGSPYYGIPAVLGRAFKAAPDVPGRRVDPTSQDRRPSDRLFRRTRAYLERRFPGMRGAPLVETRVCQYESTADDHLIVDRHPDLDNVWIVGGGSGHGFKHGPVIGELVAGLVRGEEAVEKIPPELRLGHVPAGRHF